MNLGAVEKDCKKLLSTSFPISFSPTTGTSIMYYSMMIILLKITFDLSINLQNT